MTEERLGKKCSRCRIELPLAEFGPDERMSLGRKSWCRGCHRSDARARYRAGGDAAREDSNRRSKLSYEPTRRRAWVPMSKYGLTTEAFDAMLDEQEGRCAICRTGEPGGRGEWHVDHCHETGENRGLLCAFCNPGIGYFRDDPELLRAAINYLEAHRVL